MVHPVLFKDRCSCGGRLYKVNAYGKLADSDDEILGLKCDKCKTIYFVSWDVNTGEPKPLFSKEDTIQNFLSNYRELGEK